MLEAWKAWIRRQDDILTLQTLSDRMLEDMGVERDTIRARVRGPAEEAARPEDSCGPRQRLLPEGF